MSDLAQGYLVAGQAAKASTDAKAADTKMAADATKHAEGKCGADGKAAKASVVPTRARQVQPVPRPRPATRSRPKASVAKASAVASTDVGARLVHPQSPLRAAAAGLGLRRALLQDLRDAPAGDFDFLECAPENWIHVGGPAGDALAELAQRHPLSCHGLSLSLGGSAPLDTQLLEQVGQFLETHQVPLYSEHLSYCSDDGHLYDLLPIPFTDEAVRHTAARIRRVQELLGRRIAVENVSYYLAPEPAMDELAFTNAVLAEADCDLLLDVNNVYVNACNHGYDADAFIAGLPRSASSACTWPGTWTRHRT